MIRPLRSARFGFRADASASPMVPRSLRPRKDQTIGNRCQNSGTPLRKSNKPRVAPGFSRKILKGFVLIDRPERQRLAEFFFDCIFRRRLNPLVINPIRNVDFHNQAGWKFTPRDITPAPNVHFYVDLMRVSKHDRGWLISMEQLLPSHGALKDYAGTYRFQLTVTAENAKPATCEVDVTYEGNWKNLRGVSVLKA